jgi:iron complex outermembrane receptor protein
MNPLRPAAACVRIFHVLPALVLLAGVGTARGQTAAPANEKTAASAADDVVKLEAFSVSVSVGRYIDTTSAAAMKIVVPQLDLPFSMQGLNASFLTDVRSTRLEDSFGYVTGLNKSGTNANAFTLRGFSAAGSNLQSVQIDGLPGPSSRFASPPTMDVERLEVIKGPTSVLYGQANPGGLLNIVTKSPHERRATSLAFFATTYAGQTSGFGSDVSWQGALDTTGPIDAGKHWLYRVIVGYEDKHSFRDYNYERNKYIYPSLTYRWSADTFFSLKGDWVREDRQANDGLAVPFLRIALLPPINVSYQSPDAKDTDYGESLSALFQTRLFDRWTVRGAYRTTWHTDSRYALETAQGAIASNAVNYLNSTIAPRYRIQENGKRYNFVDANTFGEVGPARFRHTLMAGFNGGREWLDTNRLAFGPSSAPVNLYRSVPDAPATYPATKASPQDRKTNFWNYGVYLSDQIKLGDYFDASLGWRWDKQDSYQWEVYTRRGIKATERKTMPSAGLVFHATASLSLYASYCEGFKPQSPGNVDANDNPDFPPESSEQVETGLKFDFLNHNLTGSVGLYDIKKRNVLTTTGKNTPSGNAIANLSGLQQSKGVEFNTAYIPVPHWQIQVGYTYIDARVRESTTVSLPGALLDNTPHHAASLWTRYNIPRGTLKGLGFGFGTTYTGARQAIITNVPTARLEVPGYARSDIGVYFRHARWDYALNVQNIFDRTYVAGVLPGDATRINPGDPRKLTFSVKVNL